MTRTAVFVGLRLASPFIRLPPPPLFFTFSTSTPFFLRLYFSTRTKIWRGAAEEEPPKNNPKTKIKGNTTRIETPFPFDSFFCETFCWFFFVCLFFLCWGSVGGWPCSVFLLFRRGFDLPSAVSFSGSRVRPHRFRLSTTLPSSTTTFSLSDFPPRIRLRRHPMAGQCSGRLRWR